MDDPAWVWPAWKFGMKRDDLFTTLHDQYNTFSFALQDPEAFHHDVYEVCHLADSPEAFHRLLADRQRQRITEIQESFESLAVEIVANPKLMASDQWQYALQLFRTKSFDSLVRYFASYLPEEYLDRHVAASCIPSSRSSYSETDSISTKASSTDGGSPPFLDDFFPNGSIINEEPCSIDTNDELPVSYASEYGRPGPSDSSESAPMVLSTSESSRHMPCCDCDCNSDADVGVEAGRFGPSYARRPRMEDDEETCQSDDSEMMTSSVCDSTETSSSCGSADSDNLDSVKSLLLRVVDDDEEEVYPTEDQVVGSVSKEAKGKWEQEQ
ncbi:hypothetical protein ESCO_002427 [Escovopsis weberi]|uniref:Uncharacterized protein n=1 Tax=Escovopsis weberi TaxID=150374 RepID=A0A0M9VSY1_ESCWE|nr:hypothetical protein ESCO_002427 [Escovopsis weberi]